LRTLGIDEISYCKGHKYATLVYDLDRSRVVWVGPGKRRESIDVFFNDVLSPYQKEQIRWACCDMSEAYIGAIGDHCPKATLVLDRFHIVKALNTAVDDVRKEQWRLASGNARKALKGLRWLLYRHSSTRSRKDSRTLKALERGKRWMTSALRSRLDPLRKFVNTLRNHYAGVLAFVGSRLTNAISEAAKGSRKNNFPFMTTGGLSSSSQNVRYVVPGGARPFAAW
jgi:transposase